MTFKAAALHDRGRPCGTESNAATMIMGVQVKELCLGTTLGNLAMTDVRFPNPVFPGDTLCGQTTIIAKRESKTRVDRGIVEFLHERYNQRGEFVASCRRKGMMLKRIVHATMAMTAA